MNVHVQGMHGLGDNIHERALVRQLLAAGDTVYLETPWPSVFHDLTASKRLFFVQKPTKLRTQAKNTQREAARYTHQRAPAGSRFVRVWYPPTSVRRERSVLRAILSEARADPSQIDFRMPVPQAWWDAAWERLRFLELPDRPVLLYRPLVERTEWDCKARNPDVTAYRALIDAIRHRFFVVSIADLVPGKEWLADKRPFLADAEFHKGELSFELLAALTKAASMVFCSPGFMVPLSQAVGTPGVVVFGGYERAYSFSAGATFTPFLGIEPVDPCDCFSHHHQCKKRIDVPAALVNINQFIDQHVGVDHASVSQHQSEQSTPARVPSALLQQGGA